MIYRLCITVNREGHKVSCVSRGVDTPAQAQSIAESGWAHDTVDGSSTVYVLSTWETLTDRSTLIRRAELRPVPIG